MSAALSLLLAGTLLTAALAKLRDPAAFAATASAFRRSAPTASDHRRKAAAERHASPGPAAGRRGWLAVPAVEIGAAVALLAGGGRLAALATAALLLLFTAVLRVLERRNVPCHCFGATPAEGSGLARNAALLAIALALTLAPAAALWTLPLTELFGAATAATGALCTYHLTRAL